MQKTEEKKYFNKNLSISERKRLFDEEVNLMMNPIPSDKFDPKTFDPIIPEDLEREIYARERKKHLGKFPTHGIEPKVVREGQMIGMYESKQDIYLIFAHKINDLIDEVESLKKEINTLKDNAKKL